MRRLSARIVVSSLALALAASTAPAGASAARTFELGGTPCELIPVPKVTAGGPLVPVGTAPCSGVRPGALVQTSVGICTFNFLFKGSDGRRYMGTAGHCILGEGPFPEDVGERTWARGAGPVARDANGKRIGEFAYAILKDPKDFALVRLDSGVSASASMCYFGGPTGINTSSAQGAVVLHQFGRGLVIGDVLPARTHVTLTMADPNHVFAHGFALPGDSGSGVISDDGKAVGVLVTIGVHVNGFVDHGVIGITRLKPQLDRAASKLRLTLTLQKASF